MLYTSHSETLAWSLGCVVQIYYSATCTLITVVITLITVVTTIITGLQMPAQNDLKLKRKMHTPSIHCWQCRRRIGPQGELHSVDAWWGALGPGMPPPLVPPPSARLLWSPRGLAGSTLTPTSEPPTKLLKEGGGTKKGTGLKQTNHRPFFCFHFPTFILVFCFSSSMQLSRSMWTRAELMLSSVFFSIFLAILLKEKWRQELPPTPPDLLQWLFGCHT